MMVLDTLDAKNVGIYVLKTLMAIMNVKFVEMMAMLVSHLVYNND